MATISLLKRPEAADFQEDRERPSIKLKLVYGHMPVKRSINFATVGEKPIDWRIAIPSIVLVVLAVALVSKVTIYDRFAALNAARDEVHRMQAEIASKTDYYNGLADISEDYAHYNTSEMTQEERDRVSRASVMDVVERLILPVAPSDSWTLSENTLSIHISDHALTEVTEMVDNLKADPAVLSCAMTSQSTTVSSTENVATEETITAELQIVFKGMEQVIEENKEAEAAADAAKQTVVEDAAGALADAIEGAILDRTPDAALQVLDGDPLEGVETP